MRRRIAAAMLFVSLASPAFAQGFGLAARAEAYIGQTARELHLPPRLWCADFMNMLLGRPGADRYAKAYARYGTPAAYGCTDCIAVIAPCRSSRWHVGVVAGYDANGNPVIVSGNHGRRVGRGTYPKTCVRYWRAP